MKKALIFLFYLATFSLITFPFILNLNKVLIGWPLDAFNYIWNVDTFWKQILSAQNPFFTDRIFYPLGTSLIFHTYAPIVSLLGIFFLRDIPLYINLLVLTSVPIAAFSAYLLVKYLTKKDVPAVVSGIVYGFSPIIISFLISQHYYFAFASPLLPLGLLSLIKFLEMGEIKDLIKLISVFWICVGIDYYTSIIFLMLIGSFLITYSAINFKDVLKMIVKNRNAILLSLSTLLIIPGFIIYSFLGNNGSGQNYLTQKSQYPQICSASVQRFITPSEFNPFLKNVGLSLEKKYSMSKNYDTPSIFLGFTVILIAVSSIFFLPSKKTLPTTVMGIFILLFSLGPISKFFEVVTVIPFLGLIDCPQRFIVGTQLSLATLVGLFLSQIGKDGLGKLLIYLITVLIVIEYSTSNLPHSNIEVPIVYKIVSQDSSHKSVLELPSGIAESKGAFGYDWSIEGLLLKQMYWQTLHGKNRVGGYTSRLDRSYYNFFENEPVISDLFQMTSLGGNWNNSRFTDQEISTFIEKFNLGFIILSPNSRQQLFSDVTENVFAKRIVKKETIDGFILLSLN